MKRIRVVQLLIAAAAVMTAALVVPAVGSGSGNGLPTKIGKGEGSLNVIEWPAYTDPSFAKEFEQQTGCIIHRKDAGSSNEMVALMRSGAGAGEASTTSSRPRVTPASASSTAAMSSR